MKKFTKDINRLKFGELFSGPGGLSHGALNAKVTDKTGKTLELVHSWASDYDEDSCTTYANNLCPDNQEDVICENVHHLNIRNLKPVDVFAYGFPCNDFSIVGKQKGFGGEFGPLYSYGVEVLNLFNPFFFIAENVGGITSANEGNAFEQILRELEMSGPGYNLTTHLYKAEEYGVPQTRHRIIIVGIRKDLNRIFRVPAPTTKDNPVPAKVALANIPEDASNHELTNHPQTVVERLTHIKPGQNVWNADIPEHLQLNVKSAKLSQIYKRLHPDQPSYTITGSGGGGTHGYHWKEPRALTNRERARIQTFPDDFIFHGGKGSVRKQIGMAVPPKLAKIIFESALKTLLDIEYDYITNNNYISEGYK